MKPLRSDTALYIPMNKVTLKGLSGGNIDGLLIAGDYSLNKPYRRTHENFDMAEEKSLPCTYTRFNLHKMFDGSIVQKQNVYLKKLD